MVGVGWLSSSSRTLCFYWGRRQELQGRQEQLEEEGVWEFDSKFSLVVQHKTSRRESDKATNTELKDCEWAEAAVEAAEAAAVDSMIIISSKPKWFGSAWTCKQALTKLHQVQISVFDTVFVILVEEKISRSTAAQCVVIVQCSCIIGFCLLALIWKRKQSENPFCVTTQRAL